MPVLWRYLLKSYFQVFGLCTSGFIAILLVMRFQEIARFAASGASKGMVFLFTAYQIPAILGYAIPISCLIAAILLFQRLSHTHELVAIRASGLGLTPILFPLLLTGALLSAVNFTVLTEIAPHSRCLSKKLIFETTSNNPLFLLQKDTLVKFKNAYFDMKSLHAGKAAQDVLVAVKNQTNGRLGVMTAKELLLDQDNLIGKKVTFISSVDGKKADGFDHLIIENQESMSTKASNFSQFLMTSDGQTSFASLTLRMLLAKRKVETQGAPLPGGRLEQEIARRLSLAIAPFTFTLIGVAFGMKIGRERAKKGIIWALCLAIFYMASYIAAKSLQHNYSLALLLYSLPHAAIILLSFRPLKHISQGVE